MEQRGTACLQRSHAHRHIGGMARSTAVDHGVVLMAYGSDRFHAQAGDLARSLRWHSPETARAVLTDQPERPSFHELFDHVIALPKDGATDCRPKLDLDLYTPFRRTLYLDSDGLVFRNLEFIFDRHAARDVVVLGRHISEGRWYGDVVAMCELAGAPSIPRFNGGVLYFARTRLAHSVFGRARELADSYTEMGFDTFNDGVADEPLLAISLAQYGIVADPRDADTSVSLLGLQGEPCLDIGTGRAEFVKNGRCVRPAVVHFAGEYSEHDSAEGEYYRVARHHLRRLTVASTTA
jgi:hypothetical protein